MTRVKDRISLLHHFQLKTDTPILGLSPGAEYGSAKRWGEDYFATIANHQLKAGWQVWLFGSSKDKPLTEVIMNLTQNRCVNLAGLVDLSQAINLLAEVDGLVTNDSGLMHVAAGLQKPLVAIYGATSPKFTPPLAEGAHVLTLNLACQPCFARVCPLKHHRCMRALLPETVLPLINQWKLHARSTH
jgi:heptosyltransferase-2